jgi:hypothetical protein
MPIICQLCDKQYDTVISGKHLKNVHGISSVEYKAQFGKDSLSTQEYRDLRRGMSSGENNPNFGNKHTDESKQLMSEKLSGRVPHNKGKKVTDPEELQKIRDMVAKREEHYKEIGHPNVGKTLSEETKEKISISVKEYVEKHNIEILERAKIIRQTKIDNGYFDTVKNKTFEKLTNIWNNLGYNVEQHTPEHYIKLTCNKCNNIVVRNKDSNINPFVCVNCFPKKSVSEAELELYNWVSCNLNLKIIPQDKSILSNGFEIDIYIPDLSLGIEYNGLYWHSEKVGKNKWYHVTKHNKCLEKNVRLIQIFEDEWIYKKEIVKSRLLHIFNISNNLDKIYARKCTIEKISSTIAKEFHELYHIQGRGSGTIAYGLKYNNNLIAVMDFAKLSISKGQEHIENHWELTRFSVIGHIPGAASKLFKKFIDEYNPESIISYSDLRWNTGNVYLKLGFINSGNTTPNYWYIQGDKRYHRFKFRKDQLVKDGYDENLTEALIMEERGFSRIWDCGHTKWIWTKNKG